MKRLTCLLLSAAILLCTLSGCSTLLSKNNSVGKTDTTVITVYNALKENLASRKKTGYLLYGARLMVNSENVGTYAYVYTDKRPDDMDYSDILVIEVNNRTGKIEKFSSPDYAVYGSIPYEMIKTGMPIDPSLFAVDSDIAVKNAAKSHYGEEDFSFNYVEATVVYDNGRTVYKVNHISLVGNCIYTAVVDVMTGDVISKSVEEL